MSPVSEVAEMPASSSLEVPSADPRPSTPVTPHLRPLVVVFTLASFLGSFLLFLVQPLAARLLLPLVGGSASLWNTSMVFFQLLLLAGYAFAHLSLGRIAAGRHPLLQAIVVLAPFLVLPVAVPAGWVLPEGEAPSLWVLTTLAVMVGLPFFALATASPTLQMWFSTTAHPRAHDPYFLYAAGNIGSVVALVGYPTVLEPLLSLRAQSRFWAGTYVAFVVAVAAAAVLGRRRPATRVNASSSGRHATVSLRRRFTWLAWSFIPSLLMLGVTLHLSTDIASFPLLWVAPLLLYLVTFIVAFAADSARRVRRSAAVVWLGGLPLGISTFVGAEVGGFAIPALLVHLGWFFAAALLCHSKLAHDRPPSTQLTDFYLTISVGGALGGVFAGLLAPMIFSVVLEYPLGIALAMLVARAPERYVTSPGVRGLAVGLLATAIVIAIVLPTQVLLFIAVAVVAGFILTGPAGVIIVASVALAGGPALLHDGQDVLRERSFFGVYTVTERGNLRELISGTTVHGSQLLDGSDDPTATTYYHPASPVGQVLAQPGAGDVGVVGLGAGSLADYSSAGDRYVFFEIDSLVVEIASDPELFQYLSSAEGEVEVIIADGRRGLADWTGSRFDVLVIDAFSSDAIPVHLLTAEAFALYLDRLDSDGAILVHVSNRFFDLAPVVSRVAAHHGADAFVQGFTPDDTAAAEGATDSVWVAVVPEGGSPPWPASSPFVPVEPSGPLWTDDYSNVLGALRLFD